MRGRVTFEVKGEERALRFTTNAVCNLEEAANMGIAEIGAELESGRVRLGLLRLLLWAGSTKSLTVEEAGDLIDEIGVMGAVEIIGRAFGAAFPDAEEADAGNGTAATG